MSGLSLLRRYAGPAPMPPSGSNAPASVARGAREICELCGNALEAEHSHVVDLAKRHLCCACRACALLFSNPGPSGGAYRTVPDRVLADPGSPITEEQWAALEIPVRMAFFFFNSAQKRWVASYPSPAGATESLLELPAWSKLASHNRLIRIMEPDVEALLVRSERNGPFESFLVPIVACYELVGIVRKSWRGFDGGDEVRAGIQTFFEALRRRSETP